MYAMLYTRPDICYVINMVGIYQSNLELKYWTEIKYMFKYLRRTKDYMLTYGDSDLILVGYIDFISCWHGI